MRDWIVLAGTHVPLFENVCEANVVIGCSCAPVNVHVAGTYEVVEYFQLDLGGQCHQCCTSSGIFRLRQGIGVSESIAGVEFQGVQFRTDFEHSSVEIHWSCPCAAHDVW